MHSFETGFLWAFFLGNAFLIDERKLYLDSIFFYMIGLLFYFTSASFKMTFFFHRLFTLHLKAQTAISIISLFQAHFINLLAYLIHQAQMVNTTEFRIILLTRILIMAIQILLPLLSSHSKQLPTHKLLSVSTQFIKNFNKC